ncbi:MAG: hypothetical protein ACKOAU_16725 [Pirellula sp.]
MKFKARRVNHWFVVATLGMTATSVAQEPCECPIEVGIGEISPEEILLQANPEAVFDEAELPGESHLFGPYIQQTIQWTELRIAAIGNSLGILTPWDPKNPANIVEDSLLIALVDPFPEGDLIAELGGYGEVLGVALEAGVYRFDLKSQLTPGLHRIRLRLTHPQNEPHSAWVSRPFWISFKHSAPNDPVIRNLPALARRTLTSTAKQQFELQHAATLDGLNQLLKYPFEDHCLIDKVQSVLGHHRTNQDPCAVDDYPIPPAIPYCDCLVPCEGCGHAVASPATPATKKPSEPPRQEGPKPEQIPSPKPDKPESDAPDKFEESRSGKRAAKERLVSTRQIPHPSESQVSGEQLEPVHAELVVPDSAQIANHLMMDLEKLQARSEQACQIARYLEAQELLQERTETCLKSKNVVSTIEFDAPAIFAANTFAGDRTGSVVGDLTILEGMKLDIYGDGRYALSFQYLRPSKPVKLHLQMQCWIDEETGWKTLTLPPISINPGNWDPNQSVKQYTYSGHSRALERSSGYLQKVRRTGSATVGFGLHNPSDLRDY